MKVIVTGADGFVGLPLVDRLAASGAEIHAVSRDARADGPRGTIWHQTNLLDAGKTAAIVKSIGATHLVHLAWITEPGVYWESPANSEWAAASAALFDAFAESGGERIVSLGSCAEYDWTGQAALAETSLLRPATRYGLEKAATHDALSKLAAKHEIEYCWPRLFLLYGPGEKRGRLVSDAITGMLRGETVRCNNPRAVRDFLHVEDVASAIASLVASKVTGAVNICSGAGGKIGEIVTEIATLVGRPELVVMAPQGGDNSSVVGSNEKLRAETGWMPQIPLRQGLGATIEWWRGRLE